MMKKTINGYFHKVTGIKTLCKVCNDQPATGFARFFENGRYSGKGFLCRKCWVTHCDIDDSRYELMLAEGMPLELIVCQ